MRLGFGEDGRQSYRGRIAVTIGIRALLDGIRDLKYADVLAGERHPEYPDLAKSRFNKEYMVLATPLPILEQTIERQEIDLMRNILKDKCKMDANLSARDLLC